MIELPNRAKLTAQKTLGPIIEGQLLQQDDAVRDRVKLKILCMRRQVIKQKDGALSPRKKVLESQDLAPVSQGILG